MFCLRYTNIVAVQCSHATTMLNTSATLRHKLKCLIEGEDTVFSVIAASNDEISDLKKSIRSERALDSLKDVGPHTLELWKVSTINKPLCEMTLLFLAQGIRLYRSQAS